LGVVLLHVASPLLVGGSEHVRLAAVQMFEGCTSPQICNVDAKQRCPFPTMLTAEAEAKLKRQVRRDFDPARWGDEKLSQRPWPDQHPRATSCARVSVEQAASNLDLSRPAIVDGVLDLWPDVKRWDLDRLLSEYGDYPFVVSSYFPDDGTEEEEEEPVTISLKDYIQYDCQQQDDSPVYVFDHLILEKQPVLASSFSRPSPFLVDYFDVMREMGAEMDHQWVLIGTTRSGAALHFDPMQTSAWNTLISGRKRWILFPPNVSVEELLPPDVVNQTTFLTANHFMHHCYPQVNPELEGCIDFIQEPGETVYIPNGWWHNVVNLELSVAVTQNFVGDHNLEDARAAVKEEDAEVAREWWAMVKGQRKRQRQERQRQQRQQQQQQRRQERQQQGQQHRQ